MFYILHLIKVAVKEKTFQKRIIKNCLTMVMFPDKLPVRVLLASGSNLIA